MKSTWPCSIHFENDAWTAYPGLPVKSGDKVTKTTPLNLCCAKTVLTQMNDKALNFLYGCPHLHYATVFYKWKGILGSLVSWHCMSAKNKRIENFWDWAFYVATLPRTISGRQRGFPILCTDFYTQFKLQSRRLWRNNIIESSKQVLFL